MQIKQNSPLVDETEKISFIITYYNIDVDMLCQCIDSIMALSLRPSEREIIVIDDGHIVERGKHDDLIALNGYYRKLHDMQAL